jgi:putative endonuclease
VATAGMRAQRLSAKEDAMNNDKKGYVYILFDKRKGTLYIGVTSDLIKRIYEHKTKATEGFTAKYKVDKLGYYEVFGDIVSAIEREKQLKGGSRQKKLALIERMNPEWKDLYNEII